MTADLRKELITANPEAFSKDPVLEPPRGRLAAETVAHHRLGDGGCPSGWALRFRIPGQEEGSPEPRPLCWGSFQEQVSRGAGINRHGEVVNTNAGGGSVV